MTAINLAPAAVKAAFLGLAALVVLVVATPVLTVGAAIVA